MSATAYRPARSPFALHCAPSQGLDLKLLRSASRDSLRRVRSLELEVVKHGCRTLYANQETHDEAAGYLQDLGFKAIAWRWHGHLKCEGTGFFARTPP